MKNLPLISLLSFTWRNNGHRFRSSLDRVPSSIRIILDVPLQLTPTLIFKLFWTNLLKSGVVEFAHVQNVSLRQTPRREISERKKEKHIWEPQPTVKWNGKAFHMKRPPVARSRDYFENNNCSTYFELCVGKVTIVGLTWLANETTVSVAFGICYSKFYSSIWISKKKMLQVKKKAIHVQTDHKSVSRRMERIAENELWWW